jgi:hypothetical protein
MFLKKLINKKKMFLKKTEQEKMNEMLTKIKKEYNLQEIEIFDLPKKFVNEKIKNNLDSIVIFKRLTYNKDIELENLSVIGAENKVVYYIGLNENLTI